MFQVQPWCEGLGNHYFLISLTHSFHSQIVQPACSIVTATLVSFSFNAFSVSLWSVRSKVLGGVEEMVQWLKGLLCKHRNLSSDPQYSHKKAGVVVPISIILALGEEGEVGRSLGLAAGSQPS